MKKRRWWRGGERSREGAAVTSIFLLSLADSSLLRSSTAIVALLDQFCVDNKQTPPSLHRSWSLILIISVLITNRESGYSNVLPSSMTMTMKTMTMTMTMTNHHLSPLALSASQYRNLRMLDWFPPLINNVILTMMIMKWIYYCVFLDIKVMKKHLALLELKMIRRQIC